ncbi:diguanylate cyclase [Chromobacterium sp. IIBBL 290-4]|uniref:sensor domain-containing diguanylate cyclase n=1 Tax=Chromobacterium sp. IIBBL 290-4 TaxID=2953890 RepID=UPI0020B763B2|nr:diguanylate cyclase [Chromobacterium sp. IIBBL 290-4]UTH75293.1 diguanylate cyclase [Chromobacterium sp. IIBBL 290-4]
MTQFFNRSRRLAIVVGPLLMLILPDAALAALRPERYAGNLASVFCLGLALACWLRGRWLRQKVRAVLQDASLGLLEFDLPRQYVTANTHTLQRLLGMPAHTRGMDCNRWLSLLHPEDRARFSIMLETPPQAPEAGYEARIRHHSGQWEWLEMTLQPVWRAGKVSRLTVICRVVTARKHQEAAILRREQQFRTLVDNSEDIVARYDLDLRCQFINRSVVRFSPLPLEEHLGKTPREKGWSEEASQRFENECRQLMQSWEARRFELELLNGAQRHIFEIRLFPEFDSAGALRTILSVDREITANRQGERLLAEENAVLEMIAGHRPLTETLEQICLMMESQQSGGMCGIMLLNEDGESLRYAAGHSLPPVYRKQIERVAIGPARGSCGTAAHWKRTIVVEDIEKSPLWQHALERTRAFGLRACWSTPIFSSERALLGTFSTYYREPRSPSQEELALVQRSAHIIAIALERDGHEKQLYRLATQDGLTELNNRRQFIELADREVERSRRYRSPLSVLMMDLDHFKSINDQHGHAVGDEVIRHFAQMCREALRACDLSGRLGGEEFAAVLPNTGLDDALQVAERLRAMVAEASHACGAAVPNYTVSIGAAMLRPDENGIDEVLTRADKQLYQAKREGRNRVCADGEAQLAHSG